MKQNYIRYFHEMKTNEEAKLEELRDYEIIIIIKVSNKVKGRPECINQRRVNRKRWN